jgi:hypothetical protein
MASPKPSSTAPNTRLQGEPPTARTHHPNPKPAPHLIPHVHISSHRGYAVDVAALRLTVAASTKIKENPALCCCSLRTSVCSRWAPRAQAGWWSCSLHILPAFTLALALASGPQHHASDPQRPKGEGLGFPTARCSHEPQEAAHHPWVQYAVGNSHTRS